MVNLHLLLYSLAVVFFAFASWPPRGPIRWEWLAAVCLTLTLIV